MAMSEKDRRIVAAVARRYPPGCGKSYFSHRSISEHDAAVAEVCSEPSSIKFG